ncbi:hypothetical protein IE53DRAFT_61830 [Violaceomyces palustris]|uniref:Uncharacterized protein n=1 Tax=Violaceomyces palustris TaxID=1673888 RepID=A0ACD0NZH6_9BASI|nr:hypothetical protein IE53DRAFT_61830 [Violaceomyces palustris]
MNHSIKTGGHRSHLSSNTWQPKWKGGSCGLAHGGLTLKFDTHRSRGGRSRRAKQAAKPPASRPPAPTSFPSSQESPLSDRFINSIVISPQPTTRNSGQIAGGFPFPLPLSLSLSPFRIVATPSIPYLYPLSCCLETAIPKPPGSLILRPIPTVQTLTVSVAHTVHPLVTSTSSLLVQPFASKTN